MTRKYSINKDRHINYLINSCWLYRILNTPLDSISKVHDFNKQRAIIVPLMVDVTLWANGRDL